MGDRTWKAGDSIPVSEPRRASFLVDADPVRYEVPLGTFTRQRMRFSERHVPERGDLVLAVETEVLRHELPPVTVTESRTVELARPASWWDYFKMQYAGRWWMGWWVRRRPARAVLFPYEIAVTANLQWWAKFPFANVPVEEFGPLGRPYMHYELGRSVRFRSWE